MRLLAVDQGSKALGLAAFDDRDPFDVRVLKPAHVSAKNRVQAMSERTLAAILQSATDARAYGEEIIRRWDVDRALIRRLVEQHDDYHGDCANDPTWNAARARLDAATQEWAQSEERADSDIAAGRVKRYESADAAIASLAPLPSGGEPTPEETCAICHQPLPCPPEAAS